MELIVKKEELQPIVMFDLLLDRLMNDFYGINIVEEEFHVGYNEYIKMRLVLDGENFILTPFELIKNTLMNIHSGFNIIRGEYIIKSTDFSFEINNLKNIISKIEVKYNGCIATLQVLNYEVLFQCMLMFTSMYVPDVRTTTEVEHIVKQCILFLLMVSDDISLVYKAKYIDFIPNTQGVYIEQEEYEEEVSDVRTTDDLSKLIELDVSDGNRSRVLELYQALSSIQDSLLSLNQQNTGRYIYTGEVRHVGLCKIGW